MPRKINAAPGSTDDGTGGTNGAAPEWRASLASVRTFACSYESAIWCAVETQQFSTMVLGASVARGFRWFQDVTESMVGPMGPVLVAVYVTLVGMGTYFFCMSLLTRRDTISANYAPS